MTRYKEWEHFSHCMRACGLRAHYKLMHETKKSLMLWSADNNKSTYISIIRTSDKCYRIIVQTKHYELLDRQDAYYITVREAHQLVDLLDQLNTNGGTLTIEPKKR